MTIAVLSDIHGNATALDAVIADIERQKADHIFVLGDIISDFAQSTRDVLRKVKNLSANVVRGNREGYMIGNANGVWDDAWSRFDQFSTNLRTWTQLDSDDISYMKALPKQMSFEYEAFSVRAVHGSPFSEFDTLKDSEEELIERSAGAIAEKLLLCGHAHRPMLRQAGEKTVVNVGSVGHNYGADNCAQYTVIRETGGEIQIDMRKVPYDFAAFKRTCDIDDVWVKLCLKSIEDGVNYNMKFLDEASKLCGCWPIPNETWRRLASEWAENGVI